MKLWTMTSTVAALALPTVTITAATVPVTLVPQPVWYRTDAPAPKALSVSARIDALRTGYGLTAPEIGDLFEVSKRSVNNWLAGARMSSRHLRHLQEIEKLLAPIKGTPDQRRSHIIGSELHERLTSKSQQLQFTEGPLQQLGI